MSDITWPATEITTGYHPSGFKIDKTTDPLNRYTLWTIKDDGKWVDAKPVCFHSLPEDGWIKLDKINWNEK